MTEPDQFKYRAFLSYSHRDSARARRLHRALETFRIDKDLVGRKTAAGPIPGTLRPIFRDREDFAAGQALSDQTRAALDASRALIVVCSPASAESAHVNEVVRLFKWRHPERPVIPVIVEGAPQDPDRECFPPAVKFMVDAEGRVADQPADVLAADPRDSGDGWQLAVAKIVARLLGLENDEVFRRAERDRRSRRRKRLGMVSLVAALAVFAGLFAWQDHRKQQTLAEIEALVARYSLVGEADAAPGARESLTDAITSIAQGAASNPRYREALELLKAGKPEEAEPLLKAVAEDKKQRASKEGKEAAEAFRNLASISAVSDPAKAREYYAEAAKLDPAHIEGMFQHGWQQWEARNLIEADRAFIQVIEAGQQGRDDRWLYWARLGIGDIRLARGDLGAAQGAYRSAGNDAERLAKADPENARWQRDLSVSYSKVGDVLVAQGNLPEALKSFRDSLAIAERLAKADPDNAGWLRDLSVSYNKVGDVLVAQGNLPEALKSFRDSLAIRKRLAKADPDNARWQRDVSVSFDRVGDALVAQGNLPEALKSFRDSSAIAERLAKTDPDNARWQRDVSVSYIKVGDVLVAQGNLPEALKSLHASHEIFERLAKTDPDNAGWQRDISVSFGRVGDVLVAQGNLPEALKSFRASHEIFERLAKADPENAGWQRDLFVSYMKIGDVLVAQGNLPEALKSFRDSLAIAERLAKADPENARWQLDLAISNERIGDMASRNGDPHQANAAFERALAIHDTLISRVPRNNQVRTASVWPRWRLAQLKGALGRPHLERALAILKELNAADRLDARRKGWIPVMESELSAP